MHGPEPEPKPQRVRRLGARRRRLRNGPSTQRRSTLDHRRGRRRRRRRSQGRWGTHGRRALGANALITAAAVVVCLCYQQNPSVPLVTVPSNPPKRSRRSPTPSSAAECPTSRCSAARRTRTWRSGSSTDWASTSARWSPRSLATSKHGNFSRPPESPYRPASRARQVPTTSARNSTVRRWFLLLPGCFSTD